MGTEPAILINNDEDERRTGTVCAANQAAVAILRRQGGEHLTAFAGAAFLLGKKYPSRDYLEREGNGVRLSARGREAVANLYVWEDDGGGISVVRGAFTSQPRGRCVGPMPARSFAVALAIHHRMAESEEDVVEY